MQLKKPGRAMPALLNPSVVTVSAARGAAMPNVCWQVLKQLLHLAGVIAPCVCLSTARYAGPCTVGCLACTTPIVPVQSVAVGNAAEYKHGKPKSLQPVGHEPKQGDCNVQSIIILRTHRRERLFAVRHCCVLWSVKPGQHMGRCDICRQIAGNSL